MRRIRFRDPAGSTRVGRVVDDRIEAAGRTYSFDAVDVLPPVEPSKVIGVGFNYRGRFEGTDEEPPERPFLWWKGGRNVVSGHGDTVTVPDTGEVIFEAELGVVVGEQCRNVAAADARSVIDGFTCVNDLTDLAHRDEDSMFRVKSFDNSVPMGPVVASPEHVPDQPRLRLWVDGEKRQDSGDDEFVFPVPEVIASITDRVTLEPGDVVLMGNPGDGSPVADGDTVAVEVEGVGRLEHDVEVA